MPARRPRIISRISISLTDWNRILLEKGRDGELYPPTAEYEKDLNGGLNDTFKRAFEDIGSRFLREKAMSDAITDPPTRLKDRVVMKGGDVIVSYDFLVVTRRPIESLIRKECGGISIRRLSDCMLGKRIISGEFKALLDSNSDYLKKHILPS
jgi:hypothetical protein